MAHFNVESARSEEVAINTILDIGSLTPDSHITEIHTPAGISTKKLMVK